MLGAPPEGRKQGSVPVMLSAVLVALLAAVDVSVDTADAALAPERAIFSHAGLNPPQHMGNLGKWTVRRAERAFFACWITFFSRKQWESFGGLWWGVRRAERASSCWHLDGGRRRLAPNHRSGHRS